MDVTLKVVTPAGEVTFWFGGVTERVGDDPACETVTTTGETPATVTVIFATRDESNVFWE